MKLSDTGLRAQPFQAHGKPLVLVPYRSQQDAIRFLNETRLNDHGLGLFLGPPLSGKTSVISQFARALADEIAVAVVDGEAKDATTLFQEILGQFGYDHGFDTVNERVNMVKVFALQQARTAQAPLLIIENAQALSPAVLELLCELAMLRVKGKSALRIVLASEKSMSPIIEAPAMEPISKRVTGKFLLRPLMQTETTDYVYKKLISAGCKNPQFLAPPEVCDRLHSASGGWPGMIDRVAMLTMANAERLPLRVDHVPQQTAKSEASDPHLILTHRHKTLGRIRLNKPQMTIGRNELCDIQINGDWVSRQHALLLRKNGTTVVVDMRSRNGTLVNGKRVSRQVLVNDDIISLGEHRLKYIDHAASRRTTLRGAGWDDTTIVKSIRNVRNKLAKQLKLRSAS